jgi:uncharacterized membrane protein YccC
MSWEYLKKAFKSRTIIMGIVITCLSFVQGIVYEFPVTPFIQGIIGCVLGILIVLLRMDTTDGIANK